MPSGILDKLFDRRLSSLKLLQLQISKKKKTIQNKALLKNIKYVFKIMNMQNKYLLACYLIGLHPSAK